MAIDIFCHIYPREYLRELVRSRLEPLLRFLDIEVSSESSHLTDGEARISLMDRWGLRMQALSLGYPALFGFTKENAIKLAKVSNDAICKLAEKYPDRFVGIATIPMQSMEDALEELDRSVRDLGLKGLQLPSNVEGRPLDSPDFLPIYERMVKYDLPILLHPADTNYYDWIRDHRLLQILGWPFDTSLGIARLVFGGILERLPDLKIVVHHLGAMIPYFAARIDFLGKSGSRMPSQYLKKLYADTVIQGWRPALECALSFFDPSHIVFATDYPFGSDPAGTLITRTIEIIKELSIPEEDKSRILEGNASKLLKL